MCEVCERAKKAGVKEGIALIAAEMKKLRGRTRDCLDQALGKLLGEGDPRSEDIFDRGLRKGLKHHP